jgi:hypothetical protein
MATRKEVPAVLVTEQVETVEPVGAWGTTVDPKRLTFAQLKFHVKARGREPFGVRADLERELKQLLTDEQETARREYFEKREVFRAPFRDLIEELRGADPDFKLEDVHTWMEEERTERRTWDWGNDKRSLAHRQRQLRRKYPTALVRRSRNPFPEAPSERERRAQEKAAERERIKERKEAQLNKERTCAWQTVRIETDDENGVSTKCSRTYYCTNRRQTMSRGRDTHNADAKFCVYHAKCCNGAAHVVESNASPSLQDAQSNTTIAGASTAALSRKKAAKRPPVRTPNELGLCSECFFKARMRRPIPMEAHTVPGALQKKDESELQADDKSKLLTAGGKKKAAAGDDMSKYATPWSKSGVAPNLAMKDFWCQWQAKDLDGNIFSCFNIRIRHPQVRNYCCVLNKWHHLHASHCRIITYVAFPHHESS